jgi:signal transduction histidine kinase
MMGPGPKSRYFKVIVASWLVIGGGFIAASLLLPADHTRLVFQDVTLCLLPLLANAALLSNADTGFRRTNSFWILIAAGCGLWLVGSLCWTYSELVAHGARAASVVGYVGNAAHFLFIVPLMAAVALQPHARGMKESLRYALLDFSLLASTWAYVYAFTTLPYITVSANPQLYLVRAWQTSVAENLVFMAGVIFAIINTKTKWRRIYLQLLGIGVLQGAGSVIGAWGTVQGAHWSGGIHGIIYTAMFLWVGTLGLTAKGVSFAPDDKRSADEEGTQWPEWLAIGAVLFVPILMAWNEFFSKAPNSVRVFRILLTLSILVAGSAMVFLRQHLVNRDRLNVVQNLQKSLNNLKRLQSQFVQSEKLASLGQLAAGAAHEINNPLTAILGYSDLLTEEPTASPRAKNLGEKIRDQARRTRELVNNLLSFARQVPAEKQLLDLASVIAGAIQLRTLDLRDKNIRIETQNRGVLPAVRGDPNQLLQVFFQLISNAVDAMESTRGGTLTIRTFRDRGDVVVEFADTGTGISEPERVFDPFYTTKPVGKGSGLGLSICYGIIQEHGGRIAGFNRLDGGATFRIELPVILAFFPQIAEPASSSTLAAK